MKRKIQFVSCGQQHLSNNILHQHTFIEFQSVKHQLSVKLGTDNSIFIEGMTYEKPCVCHVALQCIAILCQPETYIRLSAAVADIDNSGICKPKES